MQILMSKAGDALVGAKVRAIAPGAEIVTMAARDQFERDGAPFPADQVDPELAWIGLDTMTSGLVGPMRQALLDVIEEYEKLL